MADYVIDPEEKYPEGAGEGSGDIVLESYDNFTKGNSDMQAINELLSDWEFYGKSKYSLRYHGSNPQTFIEQDKTIKGDDVGMIYYAYKLGAGIELENESLKSLLADEKLTVEGVGPISYGRIKQGDILLFNTLGTPDSSGGIASQDGCFTFDRDGIGEVPVRGSGLADKITHILRYNGREDADE